MGNVGVAEQGHFRAPGGSGICQRVQIVFYAVHMAMRIEHDGLVKGGQTVHRLQSAVVAVAGHRVGPQPGVRGQGLFQVPQAVAQKNQGVNVRILLQQHPLNGGASAMAVAQDQKFCHEKSPPLIIPQSAGPVAAPAAACTLRSWNRACPVPPPWPLPWGQSPHPSAPVPAALPAPASARRRHPPRRGHRPDYIL